ncbi:MAG TPA: DUF3237 domain-containing protein [Pseudomonadales bacterium]|nr:hypothetical protein [Gammaproteobacteria bacterium]MDP6025242.1 DUF3237 domain-containing protein [Pseudomonadales bacterium]MDP6315315.1 DUF3237 domain-containing protein [Pseudomonadales bacterium]MDP7314763.1 DUF3237 domain-containing protein [Pseudomonadales bacterium]HJL61334.1 DUF3237 domain-containing protein [Pseudomonadales bacterium]
MKLEPLMTMYADLKDSVEVGEGPSGNRIIFDVTGGHFEGEKLKGKILASGADWIIMDSDGVGHLDVRITLQTDDGANIYVQYYGVLVFNEKISESQAGTRQAEFGDTYFVTQPRFETGDERYKWLNRTMAVAEGRPLKNAVEYQVYEVTNG